MNNLTDLAWKAVVPAAVIVCFGLARKYLRPSVRLSETQLSELDDRFGRTKLVVWASMILVVVAFFWTTHSLLVSWNRRLAASDGPETLLRLWPDAALWWFFPGFGAIALCWDITLQLWAVFDRSDRPKLYRLWSDGRAGMDGTRILRWMAVVLVTPIGVLTVLALPMHTAIRRQDVRVCGYAWAKCQSFDYSKAVRMTEIRGFRDRDGVFKAHAGIVIDFADGRRWSSNDIGEFRDRVDPELRALLMERTHLPLERAQTKEDIR